MKLRALSHYDGDKDTGFGDCIPINIKTIMKGMEQQHAKV